MERIKIYGLSLMLFAVIALQATPTMAVFQTAGDWQDYFQQGISNAESGRYKEATESYRQAIRLRPDFAEAFSNLGYAYGKLERYAEARAVLEQAIRLDPRLAKAHNNLGYVYAAERRYEKAIAAYLESIR